ncbi:PP2C family protein-serine/threonine phosphatase [Oryzobacter telluris]|uniref:PP2C family protein-serine/threonine phosphatase n=1 Tax=Oryzobacter telluris TaxID=3149179 RepID=UPI00370D2BC2
MTRNDVVDRLDERARLRALDALQILDTPNEERFDRLVRLAKELFGVPLAAVNLIDEERVWSKASVGSPAPEAPRADSVCNHTIRQEGAFVVPDITADDRFTGSDLLMGSGLKFYAGEPLHSGDQRIGALCVMGFEEREMSDAELRLLRVMADWVEAELVTENEMHRAMLVQRALRPSSTIAVPGFELAGQCVTARHVGGDFYDWFMARDSLHIFAGDVMGKGIGAALIASSVRAVLRGAARFISIEEAFTRTAYDLDQDLGETSTFVTAFGACIDPTTGTGHYVDAGHGLAVIVGADGVPRRLYSGGLPIGAMSGDSWQAREFFLDRGDALVVVSDGMLDFFDTPALALEALCDLQSEKLTAQEMVDRICEFAEQSGPTDDVTVVVVKRRAA